MPTYVLEGGSTAILPAKPLTLRCQVPGGAPLRLTAVREAGDEDPAAITPMAGMLVLPRLEGPVVIRVQPGTGRTFPSGSVASLSAAIEIHGDTDPERAVLARVDLSGLARRELIRVEPGPNGGLLLTALGVVADTPLPALASRARDVAREILGVDRVPASQATDLRLTVDASASMRPLVADGSVAAVVELLIGVARVTSPDRLLPTVLASDVSRPVTVGGVEELPRAVHDALSAAPLSTGFRSGPSSRTVNEGRAAHCIISDGVPADLSRDLPTDDGHERVQLIVMATRTARDVLAARAPEGTSWVELAEWGSQSAYDLLLAEDSLLRPVVQALLVGLLPPDAPVRSRVRQAEGDNPLEADDQTVMRGRGR